MPKNISGIEIEMIRFRGLLSNLVSTVRVSHASPRDDITEEKKLQVLFKRKAIEDLIEAKKVIEFLLKNFDDEFIPEADKLNFQLGEIINILEGKDLANIFLPESLNSSIYIADDPKKPHAEQIQLFIKVLGEIRNLILGSTSTALLVVANREDLNPNSRASTSSSSTSTGASSPSTDHNLT